VLVSDEISADRNLRLVHSSPRGIPNIRLGLRGDGTIRDDSEIQVGEHESLFSFPADRFTQSGAPTQKHETEAERSEERFEARHDSRKTRAACGIDPRLLAERGHGV
jgi:hypothetical protein